VDALDGAFYASFGNVEPTGKRWLLALDVSGSMDGAPSPASPASRRASRRLRWRWSPPRRATRTRSWRSRPAAVATARCAGAALSNRQRLDDICNGTRRIPFGGTDCALPMLYATQQKREFDAFAIYTDSETWAGNVHPSQALRAYREQSGINAKLAVVGMVSNGFSIADPNDAGMLDVVGFDTATPGKRGDAGLAVRRLASSPRSPSPATT
jgi:60 kDa SS-A/Ro ribonucleoprotein